MRYSTFVATVGERAGTSDTGEARRAAEAVLAAVADVLDEAERRRLAEAVPGRLRGAVRADEAPSAHAGGRLDTPELVHAVAAGTGCPPERARHYAQAVLGTLADTLADVEPGLTDELRRHVSDPDLLAPTGRGTPTGQGTMPRGSGVPTRMRPRLLDADELERELARMPGWTGDISRLRRVVALPQDRVQPLLDRVARAESDLNHHARVVPASEGVVFELWTHSVDGVTDMDLALARRIDEAADAVGSSG